MKLTLQDDYLSLKPFSSDTLTDFVVITGKNGSGKSQLLNLITLKSKNDTSVISKRIGFHPAINKIQAEGIIKNSSSSIDHDQWKLIVSNKLAIYNNFSPTKREMLRYIIETQENGDFQDVEQKSMLSTSENYTLLLKKMFAETFSTTLDKLPTVNINHQNSVLKNLVTPENIQAMRFAISVMDYSRKNENQLSDVDFFNTPHDESLIDINDLFSSQIEWVFYNYAKRRHENDYKFFQKIQYKEINESISDIVFIENFRPPWEIINEIFESNNLDFYFNGIKKEDYSKDVSLTFKLIKKSSDQTISFDNLSSGEQVIIGLILKLFVTEYYGDNLSFPDLIILDEPDAHLHPEMTKLLIDVLRETFVKKYKIKVIITTHSPSTIALSPESSIYQLRNHNNSSLKKIAKDEALKLLTNFIPTLSIDYQNHKQVFVESPVDAKYYQIVHDKLQQTKELTNKLYFISNSAGKGNCSQVYQIVDQIRSSGNKTSYGVVDWDLDNKDGEFVFTHGINERYSIENFLFDPIYIICLLMEMKAHNIYTELNFDIYMNHFLIGEQPQEELQRIIEYFFLKFEEVFPNEKYDSEKMEVEYFSGKKLLIPKWYLQMKGHDLHIKLKKVFTAFNKYTSEKLFQNELSEIMGKCFPFIPLPSTNLLKKFN